MANMAGLALAVIAAVPSHVLGGLLDHVGVIAIAGLGIWMLIVSVLLFRSDSTARACNPTNLFRLNQNIQPSQAAADSALA